MRNQDNATPARQLADILDDECGMLWNGQPHDPARLENSERLRSWLQDRLLSTLEDGDNPELQAAEMLGQTPLLTASRRLQ
jgi:hypothetical protein